MYLYHIKWENFLAWKIVRFFTNTIYYEFDYNRYSLAQQFWPNALERQSNLLFWQNLNWQFNKVPGVCGGLCNPSYWDGGIWGWPLNIEPPKGLKWPVEGPHYTWGSTRGSAHTRVPPGADWIPICLGPRGCLVMSQAPGSNLGSCGVRIDPA